MKEEKFIYKKRIKDLPKDLLPREKALKYGFSSLSDIELLAILLKTGTKDNNVLSLANRILKNGSIKNLRDLSFEDLLKIKGIGETKALEIMAINEIINRINQDESEIIISSPSEAYQHLKFLEKETQEKLMAIYLNTSNKVLAKHIIAIGSINVLNAKPRDIFYYAIQENAYGIILAHNHPNGEPKPSKEDIEFTKNISKLSLEMGFEILDHIIIAKKGYYSFANNGLL